MRYEPEQWARRVGGAIGLVLVIAIVARLAWWLLAPAVPALVALLVVGAVLGLVVGRYRR